MRTTLFISLLGIAVSTTSCGNDSRQDTESDPVNGYIAITKNTCGGIGFNGKWKLINIRIDGKNHSPDGYEELVVKNCRTASYFTGKSLSHTDTFNLYKVVQYCDDYQLVYNHDSIGCVNFRKDTMIIGTCNNMETTKYYYECLERY
ncbi:MAG: hypothetical protein K9G49_06800 [Taibaiella sp.]|nr:hypothetical protein [Taibaiella sp.]